MIDVKELELLNTTQCECGHTYSLKDFTKMEALEDAHGFYGNIVKNYSRAICPRCRKKVIMLLKPKGQTWEVINIARLKSENDIQNLEKQNETNNSTFTNISDIANTVLENMTSDEVLKVATEQTTIENETEKNQNEEFICSECGQVCKSKIGLIGHMKTHQK